jgi:hypothetical protein
MKSERRDVELANDSQATELHLQVRNAKKYQGQSWLNQPTGCQTDKREENDVFVSDTWRLIIMIILDISSSYAIFFK